MFASWSAVVIRQIMRPTDNGAFIQMDGFFGSFFFFVGRLHFLILQENSWRLALACDVIDQMLLNKQPFR